MRRRRKEKKKKKKKNKKKGGTIGYNLFTFANRNILSAIPSKNHDV